MSDQFAFRWAMFSMAGFAIFSFAGMALRVPMPSMAWCLAAGGLTGVWIVGPIVWISVRRFINADDKGSVT